MFNLTIRQNAAIDSVTIETENGRQVIDRSSISPKHADVVRMLIVNSYCEHVGEPAMFPYMTD